MGELETHWQPQHHETPHRATLKKSGNSGSHSWWWDSHISPKSSKWLQENLAEMDSKVNAMLNIIEEDADSFAKRAEMYYKRRPELVILVEEFYRTYRALVEKHTFLTKELRQNIAPALQAQLGVSFESPPNPSNDLLATPGFDIASLSSYAFPGTLEFDNESLCEFSAKKGNDGMDGAPPASSRVSFEPREFELKATSSSSEEEHLSPQYRDRKLHAASSIELEKRILILQDEKQVLMNKSGEDDVKITELQSEVSNLLSKAKALEAEDRLVKDRLNSLLEVKQSLESENLKLNHALISCKEEKTQVIETRDHGLQVMLATGERICQLEQEVSLLEHNMAASHAEIITGQEQTKRFQCECEKLQQTLVASQDEKQRDVAALREAYESCLKELQKRMLIDEEENEGFKKQLFTQSLKLQELEQQGVEVARSKRQLEEDLIVSQELKHALELESSSILSRSCELQRELEATKSNRQELLEQIAQRDERVLTLEGIVRDVQVHKDKLETDRDELGMQLLGLEAKYTELQKERDRYLAASLRLESEFKGLEAVEAQLQEQLALFSRDNKSLHEGKTSCERMLTQATSEMEELRLQLRAFSSDKSLLLQRVSDNANTLQIGNDNSSQESGMQTIYLRDLEWALSRLILEKDMLEKGRTEALHSLSDLQKASAAECDKFRESVDEHLTRIAELDSSLATLIKEKGLLETQRSEALQSNSNRKGELRVLELERVEASKHVEQLIADVGELKKAKDSAFTKCQDFEVECFALKAVEEGLKAQLELKLAEGVVLKAELEELHLQVSALFSEKASLQLELEVALEQVRITNINNSQLQAKIEDHQTECSKIVHDLRSQLTRGGELEEVVSSLLHEKEALESKEAEIQEALISLEDEKCQLTKEVKRGHALADDVNGKVVSLESENKQLSYDLKEAGQQIVRLQEVITDLSIKYTTQSVGLATLEEQLALSRLEKESDCKALASFEGKAHELEVRVSDLLVEKAVFTEQVAQMSGGIRSLEAKLCDVHKQNEALSEKLAVSFDYAVLLQKQLDSSKELEDGQQVDLQQRGERIQALQVEVESMQLQVTRAEEHGKYLICEQQIRSLDDISCLQKRIQDLEVQVRHNLEDKVLLVKTFEEQNAGHLNQLEVARKRECEKDVELLELSSLAETLRQSLLEKDLENSNLLEAVRKSTECQNAAEKRFMDEIGFLHGEEMKLRTEVTANSALMAEKVASLRMENAALHQDLSLKIELVLKQQKEVESLTENCRNLSQALHDTSAEMLDLKNDLHIFKDVVIPSMEERAVELQDEITGLTVSNERHVAEIASLRRQLKDAKSELLLLHEENSVLRIELIFNVEILKYVDVVFGIAKTHTETLCDKLGLEEKSSQILKQMLARATDESGIVNKKLSVINQEKNGLVAQVQYLLVILAEVEQLQRELAFAREDTGLVRESESAGDDPLANPDRLPNSSNGDMKAGETMHFKEQDSEPAQNIRGSSHDGEESVSDPVHTIKQGHLHFKCEESASYLKAQQQKHGSILTMQHPDGVIGSDGRTDLGTTAIVGKGSLSGSLYPFVVERLKEEISFLQEKIQRLELAAPAQGTRGLSPGAREELLSPRKNSTASSSSILTVDDRQDIGDGIQRLKEENQNLIEEIESLKGQSLATWMEHNLIENTVRDLQASKAVLEEKNGYLKSEVSSCKEHIVRLEEELHVLQQKHAELVQDVEASIQEKRKSEETLLMLEDVVGSQEGSNRRLQIENELAKEELRRLQGFFADFHDVGTEFIAQLKVKMVTTFAEVKLIVDECKKEIGDEGLVQVLMEIGQAYSAQNVHESTRILEFKQGMVTESTNEKRIQETMPELVARNRLFLTELQARAEEADVLLEVVICIRKMLLTCLSQRDTTMAVSMKVERAGKVAESPEKDLTLVGSVHHQIKLAERLHRAFVDENLEHELIELKEGRKHLKEELELRLDQVQGMESELLKLQVLLEEEGSRKRERVATHEEKKSKNKRAEETVKELHEMLAHQRGQIDKMKEEVLCGEEQQEAAAEDQVTVLASMESSPNMDEVGKELESLRSLNRRHCAELRTISQDLQSMGSIIKSAQDHLLLESSEDGEEEIVSIADLRTQNNRIIDLRAQNNRLSIDSTQLLLSPLPHMVEEGSDGSMGQFPLKPRNFGFTWFLLLFSPDRKALSLARGKSDKAVWAALRRSRRSSTALEVERAGRRKAAGCWACVSNTSRLDSFEHR